MLMEYEQELYVYTVSCTTRSGLDFYQNYFSCHTLRQPTEGTSVDYGGQEKFPPSVPSE